MVKAQRIVGPGSHIIHRLFNADLVKRYFIFTGADKLFKLLRSNIQKQSAKFVQGMSVLGTVQIIRKDGYIFQREEIGPCSQKLGNKVHGRLDVMTDFENRFIRQQRFQIPFQSFFGQLAYAAIFCKQIHIVMLRAVRKRNVCGLSGIDGDSKTDNIVKNRIRAVISRSYRANAAFINQINPVFQLGLCLNQLITFFRLFKYSVLR